MAGSRANVSALARGFSLVSVSVLDQACVSILSLVLSLTAGRRLGANGLGELALFLAGYYIALSLVRAYAAEPLLVTTPGDAQASRAFLATTIAAATTFITVGGVALHLAGRGDLVPSCLLMEAVLIQDYYRYVAFHRRRPAQALFSDAMLLAGTLAAVLLSDPATLGGLLACWGVAALGALFFQAWACKLFPASIRATREVWRSVSNRKYAFGLALDALATAVTGHVGVVVIALVASASELGTLRASQSLLQPVLVATTAVAIQAVPRLATRPELNTPEHLSRASALATLLALLALTPLCVFAPQVFELAYGDRELLHYEILIPVTVCVALQVGNAAWIASAKARRRSTSLFRIRLTTGVVMVLALWPLTARLGAVGAAWAYLGQILIMWFALARLSRVENRQLEKVMTYAD